MFAGPCSVRWRCMSRLFALALFGYLIPFNRGESWGGTTGGGGAMSATLVSSIPLPKPPTETQNVLANESKGLAESKPKETAEGRAEGDSDSRARDQEEGANTSRRRRSLRRKRSRRSRTTRFRSAKAARSADPMDRSRHSNAKGGLSFSGGTGDFGSRFGWYVDGVRRKVSDNWMKYEVDPRVDTARRVYIYFEIDRSGSPTNIRVEQSSGVPSLDQSAMRALQRIDTFGPLPPEYAGRYVAVEFWFDYKR